MPVLTEMFGCLEAELVAVLEGVVLVLEWCTHPFVLESDCATAVEIIINPIQPSTTTHRERPLSLILRGCSVQEENILYRMLYANAM